MKKERRDESFLKKPYYKGGEKAMKTFIQQHLQYPESARSLGLEGSVPLRYDINHKGDVTNVHLVSSLHPDCDAEAIRVVKLLKFEVPKTPRNLKVIFHNNIIIHFNIHQSGQETTQIPTSPQQLQIQYNITTIPSSKQEEPTKPAENIYHYTIQL